MRETTRRAALLLPIALGACTVLPERPYQEVRRFALDLERPERLPPPARGPVLLVRTLRAAPGLDVRGLSIAREDGTVQPEFWSEWAAPPAELVEDALRRWLGASGLFSAVLAPGSRLPATLTLEGELTRLQAEPAAGVARAGLSVLLLDSEGTGGQPRIRGQFLPEGTAPLPGASGGRAEVASADAAAGMTAALADAFTRLESELRRVVRPSAARRGR